MLDGVDDVLCVFLELFLECLDFRGPVSLFDTGYELVGAGLHSVDNSVGQVEEAGKHRRSVRRWHIPGGGG